MRCAPRRMLKDARWLWPMWIFWALVGFVVLGWLGYSWVAALFTKYHHTTESAAVLLALAVLAVFGGWHVSDQIAPGFSFGPKVALTAGLAFTLFSLFSFMVINVWCSLLTRKFDERLSDLEEEEDAILRRLDASRWQAIRKAEPAAADVSSARARSDDQASQLRRTLETWEQGGGAARIRSLKVLEWRQEMEGKTAPQLRAEISVLQREVAAEPDEVRRDQAKAKAALLLMAALEKESPSRDEDLEKPARPVMSEDEASSRERLQAIHADAQNQRRLKAEFMRERVTLSWRSVK